MYRLKSRQNLIKKPPVKYKLQHLFDFFMTKSNANYIIRAHNNNIQTEIHLIDDQQSVNRQQDIQNYLPVYSYGHKKANKHVGLFGKIIKNMQIQKITSQQIEERACTYKEPAFDYNCYMQVQDSKQREGLSNKQNQSQLNRQSFKQKTKKDDIHHDMNNSKKHHHIQLLNANKMNKNLKKSQNKELIDMNFSFDQINQKLSSNHMHQSSNQNSNAIKKQDAIINKLLLETSNQQSKQQSFMQQQQRIKQIFLIKSVKNIITSLTVKNLPFSANKEEVEKAKMVQIQKGKEIQQDQRGISQLKIQNFNSVCDNKDYLPGTRPIESQLYEIKENSKLQQIQIDFDLDIDFI